MKGGNDLGYMDPEILTPNIDQLANAGVRLTNNYVMNACTPYVYIEWLVHRTYTLNGLYNVRIH